MTNQTESKLREGGLRRREALVLLGGAGITGLLAGCGDDDAVSSVAGQTSDSGAASSCVLTPEVTEGPYWIDNNLTRRDIREGKGGLPLATVFTVQNARTCDPIPGADVEIWHCDALGEYSGFDTGSGGGPGAPPPPGGGGQEPSSTTRYLRGHQKANAKGQARFLTVFPGCTPGGPRTFTSRFTWEATSCTPARCSSPTRSPRPCIAEPPIDPTASPR